MLSFIDDNAILTLTHKQFLFSVLLTKICYYPHYTPWTILKYFNLLIHFFSFLIPTMYIHRARFAYTYNIASSTHTHLYNILWRKYIKKMCIIIFFNIFFFSICFWSFCFFLHYFCMLYTHKMHCVQSSKKMHLWIQVRSAQSMMLSGALT